MTDPLERDGTQSELDKLGEENALWASKHFPPTAEDAHPLRSLRLHAENLNLLGVPDTSTMAQVSCATSSR